MLNQKKLSLLIAAGLAVSLSAFPVFADDAPAPPPADGPAHHERGPRMNMFDRLEAQLKLTDDQKTTVDPILKDAQTQTEAIRKDKSVSREDKRTQTLAIIEALPAKLNPTLNADQQATLAKFVDRMKNPPEHKPRPKPADGGDQPAPGQDG